ncbi:hypothetical protein EJV46_20145 [Roseococcus sp. SYP-B2431]|uniref:hypothetical protein n=1 Tax=Roseococcus sp. SYP-B2431 TaxID=2496640 RepID=UPI00103F2365|nr:hypothetical protein [Roseococcus sp. SYP-B2431]TCH96295.1 hypothetical protein EJV46_20145 [Roseococcus sp. SYP-B2431]
MRRRAVLALSALPAWPACAQVGASLPCPGRPGDVVGLVLEGTGAPAGAVTVFGQCFRAGDLPRQAWLGARLADGRPLAAQCDVKTRHPDGSARHAVVALAAPALAAGARAAVVLTREGQAPQRLDPAPVLAAHRAELWIDQRQIDLLALMRAALADPAVQPWQSGPLALQTRVALAVTHLGASSLRLVADLAVRADGSLWVEPWLRNDGAMRAGGGPVAYGMRLVLDGREVLRAEVGRQHQYTGWGRLAGSALPPPLVRHDAGYLADAGAVPRYDTSTGVAPALLAALGEAARAPRWSRPLDPRGITQNMPQTGGRADIGPVTQSQAIWLQTGDPRAGAYAIGQAEAAGAIPWHYWDGAWMDTRRWPRLWTDGRGGPPPGGLMQPVAADTGWVLDSAHQPDLATVPYLLTGRRAFLDEMQAQASWSVLSQWTGTRGTPDRPGPAEGVNVVRGNQVRGAAWSLRQIDNAAWASPDDDPMAPWLRSTGSANWAWLRAQIPGWTSAQGEAHGWIPGEYGAPGLLPPWQQDYFAFTCAAAARRGNRDAAAVLAWMGNFLAGRFLAERRGFVRNDGAAYLLAMNADPTASRPLRSWAEIGQATRARGLSNGAGWSKTDGDYAQLALASLAMLWETTGNGDAQVAWQWLRNSGAPFISQEAFRRDPVFNIVPRGEARSACR